MSEVVTLHQSNIKSKTMTHFHCRMSVQICDEETDLLSPLIGEQSDEKEVDNIEVEIIYDSSDGEEYMPEVSDSESDGDCTKRQLNTQRDRLFAATAPTVPTPSWRYVIRARMGIAGRQYHLIDGSFAQSSTTSFIVDQAHLLQLQPLRSRWNASSCSSPITLLTTSYEVPMISLLVWRKIISRKMQQSVM